MKLADRVLSKDVRAVARLITLVENGDPEALPALKALYPHTGRAYILGVTGAPGAGKSTLVDKLTSAFRSRGQTVGIIAVDPTSPFTGGAILGDRIRMQRHYLDEGVFIRSMATRGHLGGLAVATHDVVHILDAYGMDIILIETVGVGQDEVEIVKTAHTCLVITVPGMGDDIQAIKAGILEIGDIFVVNKADREGADKMVKELEIMLGFNTYQQKSWKPLIYKTIAVKEEGIPALVEGIDAHLSYLKDSGELKKRKLNQTESEFLEILQHNLMQQAMAKVGDREAFARLLSKIVNREADPYSLVEGMVKTWFA
ncbi:MAG TPA: methylmalonyl Co-A mutase-associated GTPase MeaB [Candidatus Limnocylindrales bacterium]|nr:methylmalonyl Co-A mutase-associated GTPase MeaB [Candidatus Limnocylindrales bacterium]